MLKLLCGVALLSSATTTGLAHEIGLERHAGGVCAHVASLGFETD